MKSKTAKLISPERVIQLLDCYGANPRAWPEDERSTALALIQHSSELKRLQEEAAQLDRFLVTGTSQEPVSDYTASKLVARIVGNLPEQEMAAQGKAGKPSPGSMQWFFGSGHWLGMMAASIAVFVISISIMNLRPSEISQAPSRLVQQELDAWMWEQIAGDVDSDDEEQPLTMMSFLELDEL